jgi:outer membrane protein OmpA-like peptidoglycan-associated protein
MSVRISSLVRAVFLASSAMLLCLGSGHTQEAATKEKLLESLTPSQTITPQQRKLYEKVQTLPNGKSNQADRNEISNLVIESKAPSVDIEIYFAFNSAQIAPEAMPKLAALGQALSSSKLQNSSFLVAGHTDAKGGDAYNLALSQRRAEAVRKFLVQAYQLDPAHLTALGFGKEQPKNRENPLADENRRVQVVNLGGAK